MSTTFVRRRLPGRIALVLMLGLVAGACARAERLAIPGAEQTDAFWSRHDPESERTVDHGAFDRFLARHVETDAEGVNRVAYGAVTPADRAALDGYIRDLERTPVHRLDRAEQLAFWVNLYNARTVALILDHYPVDSIRDITFAAFAIGPWGEPLLEVAGRPLSLNDVEHRVIRPIWRDARIHYVVNCAATGCPNLAMEAYTGVTIEQALDAAARSYVNDPRGVAIDEGGRLVVSKIYLWFEEDFGFGRGPEDVLASIRRFAGPDLARALDGRDRIDAYAYDWSLNDLRRPTAVESAAALSARSGPDGRQ